jgi:hypothetical protein
LYPLVESSTSNAVVRHQTETPLQVEWRLQLDLAEHSASPFEVILTYHELA